MIINNRYVLYEQIGAGGMGVVYRAIDRLTGQRVALKQVTRVHRPVNTVQTTSIHAGQDLRMILAQEFKVLAGLRHPNIISVLDYGFDETGHPFFTMDLLEGAENIIAYGVQQPHETRISLVMQVLQALAYLHRRGILHRDLKPENMLVINGQVKLLDFGVAQPLSQSQSHEFSGTLAYMSPEALQGLPLSEGADLYAVGVIAYELFAERELYNGHTVDLLMEEILSAPPDLSALSVTPALMGFIKTLLSKSAPGRYATANEAIRALAEITGENIDIESPAIRDSFIQAAQFVGRHAELTLLMNALHAAQDEQGSSWAIVGESGVGKTRLIEELRIHALVDGMIVLEGQFIREGAMPYAAWQGVLRQLLLTVEISDEDAAILKPIIPNIEQLLGRPVPDTLEMEPPAAKLRLLNTIALLFRMLRRPAVLFLEDLHWASSENLTVLYRLHQIIHELPLLIVCCVRNDEGTHTLEGFPEARQIHLRRLTQTEIVQFSTSILGPRGQQPALIKLLKRETDGNAFFLVEVMRALAEDAGALDHIDLDHLPDHIVLSGGIQALIQRRLDRVPVGWRPLLNAAAVAGRNLDLELLARLSSGIDLQSWLSDCADAAVFSVYEGQWRFSHDKVREGILQRLSPQTLKALHQQIANVIERLYEGKEQADILAYHWDAAGNIERAIHYALIAGQQDLLAGAYQEAITLFERVWALSKDHRGSAAKRRKALLACWLAQAYWALGRYDLSGNLFQQAKEICSTIEYPEALAEALKGLGDVVRRKGNYQQARRYFGDYLTLARTMQDPIAEGIALARLGLVERNQGNWSEAHSFYNASREVFETINEPFRAANIHNSLGLLAADAGDYAQARRYIEECLTVLRSVHNSSMMALALTGLAWVNYLDGLYEPAREQSIESLTLSREQGDRWMIANNLGNLGRILCEMGQTDESCAYFHEALEIAHDMKAPPLLLDILTGVARLHQKESRAVAAIQLLSLTLSHPTTYVEVTAQATPLLVELLEQLGEAEGKSAQSQGRALKLETVTPQVITALKVGRLLKTLTPPEAF